MVDAEAGVKVLGQSMGHNPIFEEGPRAKVMCRCSPSRACTMHSFECS